MLSRPNIHCSDPSDVVNMTQQVKDNKKDNKKQTEAPFVPHVQKPSVHLPAVCNIKKVSAFMTGRGKETSLMSLACFIVHFEDSSNGNTWTKAPPALTVVMVMPLTAPESHQDGQMRH